MTFEPNVGQADERVEFVGRGKGLTVFLTREEIAVHVAKAEGGSSDPMDRRPLGASPVQDGTVTLRVVGNSGFDWKGEAELRGESNYFVGNDPTKWHTRVPHFARAETLSASRGVGMAIYGNDEGVEYDLHVAPGADISKLRLTLTGARNLRLDAAGDLLLNVGGDEVKMKGPAVYEESHHGWHSSGTRRHGPLGARRAKKHSPRRTQRTQSSKLGHKESKPKRAANPCAPKLPRGGQTTTSRRDTPCPSQSGTHTGIRSGAHRRRVDGSYVIEADGSIGFRVGPHDPNAALIVDPSLSVAYGTFLGGLETDTATSIALDPAGKIYVGGTTTSASFPGAQSGRLGPADGPSQFFIAKIDPTMTGASSLIYLTFFGGSGTQAGGLIAVNSSGDVAITGTTTATDFPVTDTSQPTSALASGNGNDVIVSEIGPAGNNLVFSTLFGGSGTQSQNGPGGIALDSTGDVYIASDVQTTPLDSASADLPVTTGAFQTTWDGQAGDAFLAIFTPPATAGGAAVLKYCSYLGTNSIGAGAPGVGGIAVDVSGNAYIAGFSANGVNGFPVKNAIQITYGGGTSDAFLMKVSPAGGGATDLVYATLLGGSGADEALGVALDSANPPNAYLTGATQSSNFPTNGTVGAYQPGLHPNAKANAFLAVVSQNGITGQASLAYSTYFGGSQMDAGQGVAVAAPNAVYVTGATTSPDLPWHNNLQAFNGAGDAFVAKFDTTSPGAASLIYVTPLGGTSPLGGTASASGNAVAADQAGHVYIAGASTSADFPTAVTTESAMNGFQAACSSCQLTPPLPDGFVAEIAENSAPMPSVYFSVGRVVFFPGSIGVASSPEPVALHNGGDANLTISGIEIAGANSSDFSLIGGGACVGPSISPGPATQCSFEVGFTPSIAGPEDAVLTVSDNAPGSPQVLELIATGQAPLAAISPVTLNFGNQPENSTSPPLTITVTNAGNQNLAFTNVVVGGPDAAQFAPTQGGPVQCGLGAPLEPDTSCELSVTFEPNAIRAFNAEIEFTDNSAGAANAQQIVTLTGVGTISAPIANLTASSLVFATQNVGSHSGSQSVILTNLGSAALSVASVAFTGTNESDFTIPATGTTCPVTGGTVTEQKNCTVAVQFAPQTPGPKNAILSFTDNAAGSPQQVTLSGTATAAPSLQVSPPSLTFAPQSEGISSTPQNVTILNSGGAAAEITGISVSGPNAGDFSSPASCTPNPVAPGNSCQIGVTFTPGATTPGLRSATLTVPTGNPPTVALSGAATQAAISVPTSVNFGSQIAGGAGGTPQPINVTNSSSGQFAGALTVTSVAKSGANPGDFALTSDSCTGSSTPPGAACTLQVAFKPLQAATCGANGGARAATLILNDNAPGSPHSIPLSGTASDFCISPAPSQGTVTSITAGQPSPPILLEIDSSAGFTGSVGLGCMVQAQESQAQSSGSCTVTTSPAANPPVVQVSPGSPGQFQFVVTSTPTGTSSAVNRGQRKYLARPGPSHVRWIVGLWLVLLLAMWALRRRQPTLARFAQGTALLLVLAVAGASCGGGGGAPADPPPTPSPYMITVTVTATVAVAGQSNVTRTFQVNLTVNPPSST